MIQLITLSIEDFKQILTDVVDERLKFHLKKPEAELEYVNDLAARKLLSGGDKPIARPTFNILRKEGKIKTFHTTDKRVVFSRQQILDYIGTR